MSRSVSICLCAFVLAGVVSVKADPADNFYAGKTITLMSGDTGGYDSYARLLANYMGAHIPGHPSIVVRNVLGAASMVSANMLYNVSTPDGLTFGSFERAIPLAPLLGDRAAHYDPAKFAWIGSSSSYRNDAFLLAIRKDLNIKSLDDLRARRQPLRLGSDGPSSEGDVGARVIGGVLGLNFKVVRGYQGTPNIILAVEQGEMDGMMIGVSSLSAARPDWFKPNSPVRFILQFGYGGSGRNPRFADVPRVDEFARTEEQRDLFSLMQLPFKIARPFAAPPHLAAEKAKLLRDAFMATGSDPDYLRVARKMGLDISPVDGDVIEGLIRQAEQMPHGLIKRYVTILSGPA